MRTLIADRWANASTFCLNTDALAQYPDLIDLSIGDPDITTDSRIIHAAAQDALDGYTHYGDPHGDPELISEIATYWAQEYNQSITPEHILITPSSALGMAQVLLAILNPGEEVIVLSPYFPVYAQQISLAGGILVDVPLQADQSYAIDAHYLGSFVTPATKAIILNNPTNPSGVMHTRNSLEAVAKVAHEHNLAVICDDIYTEYAFDSQLPFIPLRTLEGMEEHTITLMSFSKNYMMPGWRVGYVLAEPSVISAIQTVNDSLAYTTSSVSQRAALKALQIRHEICPAYVQTYRERVTTMARLLADIDWLTLVKPSGTFYLFPRVKTPQISGTEIAHRLLHEAHVLVAPGEAFGTSGFGHFRIACTVDLPILTKAAQRMSRLRM